MDRDTIQSASPDRSPAGVLRRQIASLSGVGLVLGTLFFAASLTPTLIPRSYLTQGALAGACFAIGYGLGVFSRWLWRYLELPEPHQRLRHATNIVLAGLCLSVSALFLWQAAAWQNSIRAAMKLEPVASAHPLQVCAIALATFVVLLALGRVFQLLARFLVRQTRRFVQRRVSNVLGVAAAIGLFWLLANNLLVPSIFQVLDSSYREYDALLEPERPQPTAGNKTGSAASLVKWEELGRAGREFIAAGPTAADIGAQIGRPALEPIRVYVGLRAAETPRERARLALEELKRVGGFDRALLVVITPTGTGWVDPAALDTVEYLHGGDITSVALQYSYLSSPLSLLAQPDYASEAARALFLEVYAYWTTLPKGERPRLYLHGLSLGAMNSERSAGLFEMIDDPIDGALWSGPPFESRIWRSVTDARQDGSPAWLPQFRDGRLVRFMNQDGPSVPPSAPWGSLRVVYLQYASDPIVFFDYRDFYRKPEWMNAPLGPDVSSELRWYPAVTMLQLALDMAVATVTPMGHGHVYAPEHYVDAWVAVTDPQGWTPDTLSALKRRLAAAARADGANGGTEQPYDNRGG